MHRLLHFAKGALWALALLASLGVLFGALPGYIGRAAWATQDAQGSPLALVGTWLEIGVSLSATLVSLALACLLFWKKANNRMALFLSFFLLLYASIMSGPIEYLASYWFPPRPDLDTQLMSVLLPVPVLVLFLIFPNGRFAPRWTIFLPPLALVLILLGLTFNPQELAKQNPLYAQIILGALWLLCLLAMGMQVYRYRTIYAPVERQQTKWVVYCATLWVALFIPDSIPYSYLVSHPAWVILNSASWWLTVYTLPISFALAILRYRLWDIDIIIRRTLIYTLLTLTLGLLYLGCILLSRALVAPYLGGSELAIVISTLLIAALFLPLRRRIQNAIDRRFYRRKYDAAKVLAAFGATARDETDLERLTDALVQVVDETIQPEFVGLWLCDPQARNAIEAASTRSMPH
jgi:hypothetical protein